MDLVPASSSPSDTGGQQPVRVPTRAEIRQLADDHVRAWRRATGTGANAYRVAHDQREAVERYAAQLEVAHGEVQAASFRAIYDEERHLAELHAIDLAERGADRLRTIEARRAEEQRSAGAQQSVGDQVIRGVIGAVVVLGVLSFCFN